MYTTTRSGLPLSKRKCVSAGASGAQPHHLLTYGWLHSCQQEHKNGKLAKNVARE
ncbi:hypothetical protein M408DRAFT_327718 [Serendipita vermifera MAFF 305830]|uniref:Uncharacterized protein n=1 Tax=Serendipita vermifera MAFF 305830 TaxID=933852 RepID=A0A0C2XRK3_SERVB|nr:hypothetical protein M408DRAFT_327718 [Serendipita vermifera MAFF 305830]